ncbi:MAG: patatin-like phospholipase family protein, partial [Pseudomonadota bacterium]
GRLDALEAFALGLTRRRMVRLLDVRLASGGIVEGARLLDLMDEIGLPEDCVDLGLPFVAVAADIENGREVWLDYGPLRDAIRASVALPGVISPYQVEGRWLIDGGVTNPVPVSAARAHGAEITIAVNPNARLDGMFWRPEQAITAPAASRFLEWVLARDLPGPFTRIRALLARGRAEDEDEEEPRPQYLDVVSTTIDIMTEQIRRSRLAGEPPHLLLNARLSGLSVLDFHKAEAAIAEGRRMVERHADWIRDLASRS